MTIIVMNKSDFACRQLNSVSNIAYNAATNYYFITYGNSQTVNIEGDSSYIQILWK